MNFIHGSNGEIIELQRLYREGKIKEEDMTYEQKDALNKLYDKQIEDLRLSNEYRKRKLLEYRNKNMRVSA